MKNPNPEGQKPKEIPGRQPGAQNAGDGAGVTVLGFAFRPSFGPWPSCLVLLALSVVTAAAQYSIPWSKVTGGGGTSTGGVFAVTGSIGQPDAGPTLTNGGFALTGGFWALPVAIQTEGAPVLRIEPATTGTARISWAPATPGFVLEETPSLSPAQWTRSLSGATNPVVVPATTSLRFYRLAK